MVVSLQLTASDSAGYFAAFRIAMALNLILVAANMLVMPLLSKAHESESKDNTQRITRFVALITSVPAIAFFVAFVAVGGDVLAIMNEEYRSAYAALLILSGGHLLRVLSGPGRALLQMQGHEAEFLKLTFWVSISSLLLLVPLVLIMGVLGAAIATALELAASGIIAAILCKRNLDINPTLGSLVLEHNLSAQIRVNGVFVP